MPGKNGFRKYVTWCYLALLVVASLLVFDLFVRKEFEVNFPAIDNATFTKPAGYDLNNTITNIDAHAHMLGYRTERATDRFEVFGKHYFYQFYLDSEIQHGMVSPVRSLGQVSYFYYLIYGLPNTTFVYDLSSERLQQK